MFNSNKTASINIDQMILFVFESFDSMTFIRTEVNRDEVPSMFKNNAN